MNSETIRLNMTVREADSIAYVLMTSLKNVTMLDSERKHATDAANALFRQLNYGHETNSHGDRVELS